MLVVAMTAEAQVPGSKRMAASIGAIIPVGSTADVLQAGAQSAFSIYAKPFGLRNPLRLDVGSADMAEKTLLAPSRRVVGTTLGMILANPRGGSPTGYVILGVGTYHQDRPGLRRDAFGVNAGAGMDFTLGSFGAIVEARLHCLGDGGKTKLFPLGFGLRF